MLPPPPPPPKPGHSRAEIDEFRRIAHEIVVRKMQALRLYEPLPIQKDFHECNAKVRLLRGSNRAGKAQPVDEPVLTPFGWSRMGDLSVGDIIIGGDGSPCRVLGVYPQGVKEVFRVEFDDGAATRCCDDHLWKVKIGAARFGVRRGTDVGWQVLSLKEIRRRCGDNLESAPARPVIPSPEISLPKRPVKVDPYLLGILLGDGTFSQGMIGFTSADDELVDVVRATIPPELSVKRKSKYDYSISGSGAVSHKNALRATLEWYGLMGCRSEAKFVPDDYLFNSKDVRLAVLQGLMDTDGCCSARGGRASCVEFSTTSPTLAKNIEFLVRSLGGKCTTTWRTTTYTYRGSRRTGRPSARCIIRFDAGLVPFRLTRKSEAYSSRMAGTRNRVMRSITAAGSSECVCIAVDSPDHTYVTNDCIVTHNTLVAAVECARIVLGKDPRFPARDGRCYIVGKDEKHLGEVIYRKLFRPGAFRMIRDLKTGEWRAFRPWDPSDAARRKETKPSLPLIPQREIVSISWNKKVSSIPEKVVLRNGWEIDFFSSLAKPPRGSDLDFVWLDEEIVDGDWVPEMLARLIDRQGRLIWGFTPQTGSDRAFELHQRCDEELEDWRQSGFAAEKEPANREFVILIRDNPHFTDKEKKEHASSFSPEEQLVRIEGEYAIEAAKIYPEFNQQIHNIPYFDIPMDWTRYAVIDPGRQICAVLFAAVPPDDAEFPAGTKNDKGEPVMIQCEGKEFVFLYDELYIPNCDAEQFGERMARKCLGQDFEAFIIDGHGSRSAEAGSGKTVEQQYRDQLQKRGVRSRVTGHGFVAGSDDVAGRVEAFRGWLKLRSYGLPKVLLVEMKDKLPNFVYEIQRWRFKKTKEGVTDQPESRGRTHQMACAGYLAHYDPKFVKPSRNAGRPTGAYAMFLEKMARRARSEGPRSITLGPSR